MEERPVDGVTFAVTHQALVFLENTNPTTIVICGHNWACITVCFALLLAPFVAFLDSHRHHSRFYCLEAKAGFDFTNTNTIQTQ